MPPRLIRDRDFIVSLQEAFKFAAPIVEELRDKTVGAQTPQLVIRRCSATWRSSGPVDNRGSVEVSDARTAEALPLSVHRCSGSDSGIGDLLPCRCAGHRRTYLFRSVASRQRCPVRGASRGAGSRRRSIAGRTRRRSDGVLDAVVRQSRGDPQRRWRLGRRIDFLFAITPEDWISRRNLAGTEGLRDYDLAFRQELNNGKVVLVGAVARGGSGEEDGLLLAHPDYLLSLPNTDFVSGVGFADLTTDQDGGVRRYEVAPQLNLPADLASGAPRYALGALLAARAAGVDPAAVPWRLGSQSITADRVSTISYTGPPGTIPRVSLSQVLADGAANDPAVRALRDKVVIIGGDFRGMNDIHSTPYSGRLIANGSGLMAGAEIQANIVETLLSGKATEPAPAWMRWLLFSTFIAVTTWGYKRRHHDRLVELASALALSLLIGFAAFQRFWLLPSASLQLGLMTAYCSHSASA